MVIATCLKGPCWHGPLHVSRWSPHQVQQPPLRFVANRNSGEPHSGFGGPLGWTPGSCVSGWSCIIDMQGPGFLAPPLTVAAMSHPDSSGLGSSLLVDLIVFYCCVASALHGTFMCWCGM